MAKFHIEDLTTTDKIQDLQSYLSKFGELKICHINQGKFNFCKIIKHNSMQKIIRSHMLLHNIRICNQLTILCERKIVHTCSIIILFIFIVNYVQYLISKSIECIEIYARYRLEKSYPPAYQSVN